MTENTAHLAGLLPAADFASKAESGRSAARHVVRASDQRPIDSVEHSPQALAKMPKWRRVFTHPALLWLPSLVALMLGTVVVIIPLDLITAGIGNDELGVWLTFVAVMVGYALMVLVEYRRPVEIMAKPIRRLLQGLALGTALMVIVVAIIWVLGGIEFSGMRSQFSWFPALMMLGFNAGIAEELIFRGFLYRFVEQLFGTWAGVLVSAFLFGFVHITNPDGSWTSAMAIAIEAGILFGVLYALTRSMWLVIGLHFSWNVVQGIVFGIDVSGTNMFEGWLISAPRGNALISGGIFGVEASIIAIIVCSAVSVWAIRLLIKKGDIVPPFWRQNSVIAAPAETDTPLRTAEQSRQNPPSAAGAVGDDSRQV